MNNNYLITVIIPVFNVKPYLIDALESVINQTYKRLEIIIIDDGSTDGSGEICDEYAQKDDRIRVVHQNNKGLSAARNVGLDLLSGDIIAFFDSDDIYHTDFIEKMVEAMLENNTDIVLCKYTRQRDIKGKGILTDDHKKQTTGFVSNLRGRSQRETHPVVFLPFLVRSH